MVMRVLWLAMVASTEGIRAREGELMMTTLMMTIPITTTAMRAMVPTISEIAGFSPTGLLCPDGFMRYPSGAPRPDHPEKEGFSSTRLPLHNYRMGKYINILCNFMGAGGTPRSRQILSLW